MGYRLGIDDNKRNCIFYGTKYYGYVGEDVYELLHEGSKSCKYLYNKKYVDDYTYWNYGIDNDIKLKKNEILRFIKLYIKDLLENGYPINNEMIDELFECYINIKSKLNNIYYINWC